MVFPVKQINPEILNKAIELNGKTVQISDKLAVKSAFEWRSYLADITVHIKEKQLTIGGRI